MPRLLLYAADLCAVALLTALAEWGTWQWTAGTSRTTAVAIGAFVAMCAGMSLPLIHAQLRHARGPLPPPAEPIDGAALAREVAALRARIDRLPADLAEAMVRQARLGAMPRSDSDEGDIARYMQRPGDRTR